MNTLIEKIAGSYTRFFAMLIMIIYAVIGVVLMFFEPAIEFYIAYFAFMAILGVFLGRRI